MKYFLLAVALALPVSAQVYKCEVDGKTTFSQVPCAENAEVTDYSRESEELTTPAASNQTTVSEAAATIDRLGNSVKKRDMAEKIKRLERQRDRQIANRDAEVAKIKSQSGRYVQNLYGVMYEDKINSSIVAATTIWNTRIDATNREIDQLRAEYDKL
ncbi:DUF4124 domain-containing protein [Rheinheimera aquimaris]|uniref:DUF4124 domain-containing protein n=1 Tax=Rheinheimera aquimaris TaxID=412437 RepID=UPI003A98064D